MEEPVKDKQLLFWPTKGIEINYQTTIRIEINPWETPQEVWENVNLGNLNGDPRVVYHEYTEGSSYFSDEDGGEVPDPEEHLKHIEEE